MCAVCFRQVGCSPNSWTSMRNILPLRLKFCCSHYFEITTSQPYFQIENSSPHVASPRAGSQPGTAHAVRSSEASEGLALGRSDCHSITQVPRPAVERALAPALLGYLGAVNQLNSMNLMTISLFPPDAI